MTQYKEINAYEFLHRILEEEKDFEGITLSDNTDLTRLDNYPDVQHYLYNLGEEKHKDNPINLSYSRLFGINAPGLFLPHLLASDSDFSMSIFNRGCFNHADFCKSKFRGTKLKEINAYEAHFIDTDFSEYQLPDGKSEKSDLWLGDFYRAHFDNTNFNGAILKKAMFRRAFFPDVDFTLSDLEETCFSQAELRRAKNLDKAVNIGLAFYLKTVLTKEQVAEIEKQEKDAKKTRFVIKE